MSLASKGNKRRLGSKASEETKQKMRNAHTGIKNHFYGKQHSAETKLKCSLGRKGKPISEQHKQAIRDYWKRRRETPILQLAVNQ